MAALTRDWMEAGAVGLNTGLDYQPAANCEIDELIELARVAGEYGGVYAAHMRYNRAGKPEAYRESIAIGRDAGVPVRLSHELVDDETEPLLDEAVRAGVDFGIDQYLYPAGSSHLLVWLEAEEQIGGFDATVAPAAGGSRASTPGRGARRGTDPRGGRRGREYFSETRTGQHIGRSISEIAARSRQAGRRDRGRPHHRGVARRPAGLPPRDVRGDIRGDRAALTRPSGVHGRERRRLPRRARHTRAATAATRRSSVTTCATSAR